MILAVSEPDEHLEAVLDALDRLGAEAAVLDTADFPARARLSLLPGAGFELALPGGATVAAAGLRAVWWRRPRPPVLPADLDPGDAAFAARQAEAALAGLWATLDGVRWMNQPWLDGAAQQKPRQLAAAARAGLPIPPTLVTNDPAAAAAFLDAHAPAPVIHKALHATPGDWRTTAVVGPEDRAHLDHLALAPVILQPLVPGVDVRVTLAGDALFAAEIDARETGSPEDFRPVFEEARVAPTSLPPGVSARLRAVAHDLGLAYAAFDLRRREDGVHVFLEANPSGQFLFVERRTGLPIAEAVARWLAGAG